MGLKAFRATSTELTSSAMQWSLWRGRNCPIFIGYFEDDRPAGHFQSLMPFEDSTILDMINFRDSNSYHDNYLNRIPVPLARVWLRYHGRAIAGVKGNFKKSWTDLSRRYCDLGVNEEQEHLKECEGTDYERRSLNLQK